MSYKKKVNYIFKNNILDSKFINKLFSYLDKGKIKLCYKNKNIWRINNWVKKLILIYIKFKEKKLVSNNFFSFDKFYSKFSKKNVKYFYKKNIRFTCLSFVRYGSYLSNNIVMMPCFVNVGSYIGKNTMLDTWCSIGSCARIGSNVHISGGVGIGGVLEPINSFPVIVENNCFIGARSEIVEGTIIKKNSVISMGVFIGKSTRIYDRINKKFYFSYVPSGSVVVSGCLNYGIFSLYSAIIVKKRDLKTNDKIKINKNLRIFND